MDVALAAAGRPPPLYHCHEYSSGDEEVKAWISGEKRNRDLVASWGLVRGFECPVIVETTGTTDILSRSSAQIIRARSNFVLDMMIAKAEVLKDGHDCSADLMNRDVRPAFVPSISALIGEKTFLLDFSSHSIKIDSFFSEPRCEDLGMNVALGPLGYYIQGRRKESQFREGIFWHPPSVKCLCKPLQLSQRP